MTLERFRQVRNLYEAALEKDPAERAEFLLQACRGDDELGREVERLLIANEHAADFIDGPLLASVDPHSGLGGPVRMEGRRVGAYVILREIGRGGMGAVYLASRADKVVQKQVAIKIVRTDMGQGDVLRRFQRERDILAALDHPAIARFIDGGSTEDGLPYFVMDYIEGEPIDVWCDRRKLNVTERLRLFLAVFEAVQYAHQRLIVHRDLKPANILVTTDGEVKLLDFGIARLLDREGMGQDAANTVTMMVAMTPEYASPEQVLGEAVHTTSDIYALGVVLYELLTGHRPYGMRSRILHEVARVICEEIPTRPSAVITETDGVKGPPEGGGTISEVREGDADRLRRRLEGDLDNILLRALQKEPARRYSSADQFSEDVRRHLTGLPVSARKDTLWYRAGKFIQRRQVGLSATVLIIAGLVAGLFTTLWQTRKTLEALTRQLPGGGTGILTPEFTQFAFLLWIGFAVMLYFTRATAKRGMGALAGGVLFMLLFLAEETLPPGLRHFAWSVSAPPSPLVYQMLAPFGGIIALLGWRVTRKFGWRGQLAFLLAAGIGGPLRDYMWAISLPGVHLAPGLQPWVVDSLFWLSSVGFGQATVRLIAGPAASGRSAAFSWKF